MIDPKTLPLRDIHLPAPIPWWPPALGWWLVTGAVLALALVFCAALWWRHRTALRRAGRRRLRAIRLAYAEHRDAHRLARDISQLCRQVGLRLFPSLESAAVTGERWLDLLDALGAQGFFTRGAGRILAEAPYNPHAAFDPDALVAGVERWLTRLPRRPALPPPGPLGV
jgi:hypothetical protein